VFAVCDTVVQHKLRERGLRERGCKHTKVFLPLKRKSYSSSPGIVAPGVSALSLALTHTHTHTVALRQLLFLLYICGSFFENETDESDERL
jgi:hypothetical protein